LWGAQNEELIGAEKAGKRWGVKKSQPKEKKQRPGGRGEGKRGSTSERGGPRPINNLSRGSGKRGGA